MSEAASQRGDAKLKTEADADCVFPCPSATSARYRTVERALVGDAEPKGFCFLRMSKLLLSRSPSPRLATPALLR